MKMLLGLLVVGGGIAAMCHYSGMLHSPTAECKETMAKMQKCSTMAEVLAVAEPEKISIYENYPYTLSNGQEIDQWKPGPEVNF
ncbi:MAG: hypothetical protein KDB61_13510, partial [Planctomycetes bacterium]|nr:hypothetical protein [Planctomycetota bacterium]